MNILGPSIATDGLVLYLDAANQRCINSRENLVPWSQDFTTGWAVGGAASYAVTTGYTSLFTAPDGTNTAQLLTDSDAVGAEGVYWDSTVFAITPSSGIAYTVSAHVKKYNSSEVDIYNFFTGIGLRGSHVVYNFDTDTLDAAGADGGGATPINVGRQLLTNGWVRVYYTITDALGTNNTMFMRIWPVDRTASYTGSTLVWGCSITSSSYVKAYASTTSTTLIRNTSTCNSLVSDMQGSITGQIDFSSSSLGAFRWDGNTSSNILQIPYTAALNFDTGQTIILWLKTAAGSTSRRRNPYNQAYAGGGTITQEYTAGSGYYYNYYFGVSGADGPEGAYTGLTLNTYVSTGTTVQLAVTRNNASIVWYVNGRVSDSYANPYSSITTGTNPITLGAGYTGYGWAGELYKLQVYTRGLSASEVEKNFQSFRGQFGI